MDSPHDCSPGEKKGFLILSRGRRGQTVNGMADQAPGKSRTDWNTHMTKKLSRLLFSGPMRPLVFGAVMALTKIPIIGPVIYTMADLGSPFHWFMVLYYTRSFPHFLQPALPLNHPALWAGPFLVYGLIVGLLFPLKSGNAAQIAESIAVKFLLTLLAAGLMTMCTGMYIFGAK